MLSPSMPFWGLPCGAPRFWRVRVAKDFSKPKYYIGQLVAHNITVPRVSTEFVTVIGFAWSGIDWQWLIDVEESHPWFKPYEMEFHWVDEKELTLP